MEKDESAAASVGNKHEKYALADKMRVDMSFEVSATQRQRSRGK